MFRYAPDPEVVVEKKEDQKTNSFDHVSSVDGQTVSTPNELGDYRGNMV